MGSVLTHLPGALAAVMLLAGSAPAPSLEVKASLAGGVVSVSGSYAAKSAPIVWEGFVVTEARRNGTFAFKTTIVPMDCIGTVSEGTSSAEVRIEGCSTVTTGLPGTGQSITYAPGDDGDVLAGGPLSYTVNGNGTITDDRTGLTWETKTEANVADQYIWEEALEYVAALNAMNGGAGFAGHNDWRLPNVKELLSIVDYGRSGPLIDPIFGPSGEFIRGFTGLRPRGPRSSQRVMRGRWISRTRSGVTPG